MSSTNNRGWLRMIAEGDPVNRNAISVFLILILALIAAQAVPPPFFLVTALNGEALMTRLSAKVTPYASALGLFQGWTMFAPDPMRENTYIDAEITYRDGRKHIWTFPQMHELGYIERYTKERFRKFANERLFVPSNEALWPDAARFIARLNADASNPPKTVKLVHYRSIISAPPPPGELPPPDLWERHVFFTYNVNPGDLL